MFRIQGSVVRNALLTGFIALGLTSTAIAQTAAPATGLGQAWPNATDVSASPNWHVYVFMLHGIKYIQVNDLSGTVHAAVGAANGTAIVLPIGVDAQNVKTTTTSSPASAATETIYRDSTTTVTATPTAAGTTAIVLEQACDDPYNCSSL